MSEARPSTTTVPVAASRGSRDGLLRQAEAGERLCALSADPLHACDGRYNACEGTLFVSCSWGFPTSRQDCASDGRVCVDTSSDFSNCALSSTPDPRCDGSHAACEGDTVVVCEKGYAIQQKDCPGCHLKSSGAFDSSEHNCE